MSYSEWKTVKLIEIVDTQIDNRGRNPDKYLDYSDHPVIDNYLIKNQKYPDMSEVKRYINKDNFENFLRGYLKKDDVLITLVGNGIGNVTMAPSNKSVIVQNTIGLRTNKNASNTFLYYLLLFYQDEIKNFNRGTSQPSIKKTDLFNIAIQIPPLQEQKAIAHILSTLDNKIEVNNQINKTLENMAQVIFKQWFVDFEFPNEDGEPYKSSGGEMVESELGMIPKGWEVGDFSDVVEFIGGFSFMRKDYLETGKYKVITIKNVLDGKFDSSSVKYLDTIPEKMKDVQKLEKGDILMSLTGNVARVCIVSENDCLLNQRVAKIQEKSNFSRGYIYVLFRSQLVKEILLAIAKGTAQLNLSPVEAQKMKIIIPCDKVIDKISVIYDSLFNLLLQSTDEIKLLEKLRDSLLPKLMSGEIRVPLDEEGDVS